MKELKLIEMMGNVDQALLIRANAPVPLFSKPRFRAAFAAAVVAALLAISMVASPIAMVVSYGNAHPDIEGGLVYVMDAIIKDEDHFLSSLLPDGVKNTLGSFFDALTGGDEDEGESESESESESETEPEFVMPPASKGLKMEFNENHDGYRVMGMGTCKDKNLVIPAEYNGYPVTEIYWNRTSGDYAFEGNTLIETLIIPASVQSINEFAFYKCSSLKSVIIVEGEAPLTIGMCAFSGCPLEEFVVPENTLRFLDPFGFTNTDTTYEKTFPKVTEYQNAYYLGNEKNPYRVLVKVKDESITACEIHPDTKIIGGGAFYKSNITEIVIPEGVVAIDDGAFSQTKSLTAFSFPDSLRFVGKQAFVDCGAVNSTSDYDFVGDEANPYLILIGCSMLKDDIEPSTRYIADGAFSGARTLPKQFGYSLTIPENVCYIGDYAFNGVQNMDDFQSLIILGDDLYIGKNAFSSLERISTLHIGAGVTYITPKTFLWMPKLETITVEENNPVYSGRDNCLIEVASGTLLLGCRNSVVPSDGSILHIASGAFYDCNTLSENIVPDGVISIGSFAFYGVNFGQNEFNVPASVAQIGEKAFRTATIIRYQGTKAQWLEIQSDAVSGNYRIICTDGEIIATP